MRFAAAARSRPTSRFLRPARFPKRSSKRGGSATSAASEPQDETTGLRIGVRMSTSDPATTRHTSRRDVRIEWGDCDPAGIVYFPRYFAIFDSCTAGAFESVGFPKPMLLRKFGIVGIPMVDVRASFSAPCTFGDDVVVETQITEWGRSSFKVHHRLLKGAVIAVEGFEVRVWTGRDPTDPSRLRAQPIPRELIDLFQEKGASQR